MNCVYQLQHCDSEITIQSYSELLGNLSRHYSLAKNMMKSTHKHRSETRFPTIGHFVLEKHTISLEVDKIFRLISALFTEKYQYIKNKKIKTLFSIFEKMADV